MAKSNRGKGALQALAGLGAAALLAPASELRWARASQPLTDRWEHVPVEKRGATLLGISYRPRQVEALGLDARATLPVLLDHPFPLVRLGAYWDEIEPAPGMFCPAELDWQVEAAGRAGKQVIVCVGAVKTFGYPEFFVPAHHRRAPLPEGSLVGPDSHPALLAAATEHLTRLVERYRDRRAIIAWQVEHEAVDPLGMEHSWRLSERFVAREVEAVRAADPTRPIMMNGFLPTSLAVAAQQWWRTRDQGDSLAVATRHADVVGIDFYPRHALVGVGHRALYLDGSRRSWQQRRRQKLQATAARSGQRVMVAEGQAEPWEAVTTPPNPYRGAMYSCRPEQVIENFNQCLRWDPALWAYLFWGAEYWLLRQRGGDDRYVRAFDRVLAVSGDA